MTDLNRKVLNPLFNVSVTGSTVEDYTQHALLLPAKAKSPPPPVLNLSQGEKWDWQKCCNIRILGVLIIINLMDHLLLKFATQICPYVGYI